MHLYLYFNEKNLKPCKMFIYVCMYVCMFACVYNFHMKLKYPCCCFAEAPALQHLFFFKKTLSFMMFDLTHCHSS